MISNPLPPQAFTKDTLMLAYQWLQTQSPSIKELATSPDVLVSLYFKAKSQGIEFLEKPSIQNFKNELREIAGKIGEFEAKESPKAPAAAPKTSIQTPSISPALDFQSLDTNSKQMVSEVRALFNLSSDQEALRLIISTGHQKLKKFITNGSL